MMTEGAGSTGNLQRAFIGLLCAVLAIVLLNETFTYHNGTNIDGNTDAAMLRFETRLQAIEEALSQHLSTPHREVDVNPSPLLAIQNATERVDEASLFDSKAEEDIKEATATEAKEKIEAGSVVKGQHEGSLMCLIQCVEADAEGVAHALKIASILARVGCDAVRLVTVKEKVKDAKPGDRL